MSIITCQDLALGYDGRIILQNLNFSINAGDYFCIVGENGSGKSTLMKTLLRLQPPVGGSILLGDGLSQNEIGYLPQQTFVQRDFPASVREIVRSGCQNRCGLRPFYSKAEKALAEEAMKKMRVDQLAGRCYRELSGGQQQRVLLARALCATQRVLLLDEPVSGLDPKVTAEMYNLIQELNRKDGITIIMISHDIAAAVTYASHILHIGQKIFCGTKQEYLRSEAGRSFAGFAGSAAGYEQSVPVRNYEDEAGNSPDRSNGDKAGNAPVRNYAGEAGSVPGYDQSESIRNRTGGAQSTAEHEQNVAIRRKSGSGRKKKKARREMMKMTGGEQRA